MSIQFLWAVSCIFKFKWPDEFWYYVLVWIVIMSGNILDFGNGLASLNFSQFPAKHMLSQAKNNHGKIMSFLAFISHYMQASSFYSVSAL